MIVAIHQPHFLPWLGYLDRMQKADLFILLDHVQFERQNYQNRVQVKTGEGSRWITVPVQHVWPEQPIVHKIIDNQRDGRLRWGRKAYLTMQYAYQGAPFFNIYAPELKGIFDTRWDRLIDLNLALTDMMRKAFGITTRMVRSSQLDISGQKSDLVLNLCRAVGADTFLGGLGGSQEYLDVDAFQKEGIRVIWQEFSHPTYVQHPRPERFIKGLSALDMMFAVGPECGNILRERAVAYA
jgi:hypothetical protein